MSDLQCPVTILLVPSLDADRGRVLAERLADRRLAHVWTSTQAGSLQTARIVAARYRLMMTIRAELDELDPDRIASAEFGRGPLARAGDVLTELADLHRGETVLVVSHPGWLNLVVPALPRLRVEPVAEPSLIEVIADADDWVCTSWEPLD